MGEVRRIFVAVPLDDSVRHGLSALLRERIPRGIPGRPVPPENWHLTLRFIGPVDDPTVDRVSQVLDEADLGASFRVRWGPLGAFPNARRARVLWVGLTAGAEAAAGLAERVEDALDRASLGPADRPFRGHLTVSRLRPVQDLTPIVESVEPLDVAMRVDRITLFESHLSRRGARYEALEEFPLSR